MSISPAARAFADSGGVRDRRAEEDGAAGRETVGADEDEDEDEDADEDGDGDSGVADVDATGAGLNVERAIDRPSELCEQAAQVTTASSHQRVRFIPRSSRATGLGDKGRDEGRDRTARPVRARVRPMRVHHLNCGTMTPL